MARVASLNFEKNCYFGIIFGRIWARLFIFFASRRQIIYFHVFEGQNIYFQKVPGPPPPQDQMVVPLTREEWTKMKEDKSGKWMCMH